MQGETIMPSYCFRQNQIRERGGSVVECRTPEREVRGSRPTAAVLCPWARHFTPRKYWLITQEAMAPSRHDWKIVDWDVKPQHNQPTNQQNQILFTVNKIEPQHDKTNKMCVRPAKIQISLGIRPDWSESFLSAWKKLGSLATHWAHSEDSDQTGRMPRLIWVFAGRTVILLAAQLSKLANNQQ